MSDQRSDHRCVEAQFVYADGTVARAEAAEAEMAEHAAFAMLPDLSGWTVTRPLRMVYWTPCGRYFDGDDVHPQGVEDDEGQVEPFRKMVPTECVFRTTGGVPRLRGAEGFYRVVVEFVPKEGGKR